MLYAPNLQSTALKSPLHMALYEAIKKDIVSGKLRPHDRLPSIRALAKQLSVSTTPVETSYQQLAAEGFIESLPRQGMYVAPLPDVYGTLSLSSEPPSGVQDQILHPAEATYEFDFHMAKNDFSCFPIDTWRKLLNQTLREEADELLFYGNPQGEAGLRAELASYLYRFRGVICRPQQIVIGAEQHLLMHLLGVMMQDFSPCIAAENPCYPLIPSAFRQQGYEVFPLTEADDGITTNRLEQMTSRILTVAPSHQFPGGRVMTIQERLDLLQWAKEKGACVIEDDYGGELRYQGRPIAALQGLDPAALVVYVGGFSQILAPDLCIHYMVLPEALLEGFHEARRKLMFELSSSRIYQRTLQKFMQQGFFDKHVRKMRNLYRKKNRLLADSLEAEFDGNGRVVNADAGLHLILKVKARATERDMVEAAGKQGIRIAAASPFYWGNVPPPSAERQFIIGFGGIPSERIRAGVKLLRETWRPYFT